MSEEKANDWHSWARGHFDTVIMDEAHKANTTNTNVSLSLTTLDAPHYILLTATPMINRLIDLTGPLKILLKTEWRMADDEGLDMEIDPSALDIPRILQLGF